MSKDIPNYSIVLDTRERKLQTACKELVIPYKTSSLALGDIHVISEKDGSIQMMIERKAWPDLASSILDNRYREQHARYTQWSREQLCEVWYVLEGPRKFRTPAQEKRTMSAYLSLCFDKQVRVIETKSPLATMEWLHKVLQKIQSRGLSWMSCGMLGCIPKECSTESNTEETELAQQKVAKIGKKQHTKLSTWIAMLSCIYGMSVDKAKCILTSWESPDKFVSWLRSTEEKEAEKHLAGIKITTGTNKQRKLGKVLAKRIVSMFYYIKEQ